MFNQYHRNIVDVNLQYLYRQKKNGIILLILQMIKFYINISVTWKFLYYLYTTWICKNKKIL